MEAKGFVVVGAVDGARSRTLQTIVGEAVQWEGVLGIAPPGAADPAIIHRNVPAAGGVVERSIAAAEIVPRSASIFGHEEGLRGAIANIGQPDSLVGDHGPGTVGGR